MEDWTNTNDELICELIENNILHNDYYEKIKLEYFTAKDNNTRRQIVAEIFDCYDNYFGAYYSVFCVMDSIEEYLREHDTSIFKVLEDENFTIKEF